MKNKNIKTKNNQGRTIHQHIEYVARHRAMLAFVLALMVLGVISLDSRVRSVMQQAYAEGFAWIGTYMHHEHPAHNHGAAGSVRMTTISGPGS